MLHALSVWVANAALDRAKMRGELMWFGHRMKSGGVHAAFERWFEALEGALASALATLSCSVSSVCCLVCTEIVALRRRHLAAVHGCADAATLARTASRPLWSPQRPLRP